MLEQNIGKLTNQYSAPTLNFYEMTIGVIFISIYMFYFGEFNKLFFQFSVNAFFWILILSSVFNAYAITKSISLMKVLNQYSIMLILSMEPIYVIILALIIFGENEFMNFYFYIGLALTMIAIISNSVYKSRASA